MSWILCCEECITCLIQKHGVRGEGGGCSIACIQGADTHRQYETCSFVGAFLHPKPLLI